MKNKRKVALKRLRKAENKMSREYQILKELKGCEHCVELHDIFYTVEHNEKLVQNLVFEYVSDSLENFIQEVKGQHKHIPLASIKSITKQILEGLEFVHEKNICHRDLKPDNVLLDKDHNAKLCDFGSAKKIDSKDKRNIPHIVSRYYRAPELIFCHTDYSTPVDIWAVGCIFMEMFTLEPLFQGKTEGLQLFEILALLGSPSAKDKEYLYGFLSEEAKKATERIKDFQAIDLRVVFPEKEYRTADIDKAADLAKSMLQWNPHKRITAKEALKHPFFQFFQIA